MDVYKLVFVIAVANAQQIINPPVNTAVYIGQQTRLSCVASLAGNTLEWRHRLNYTDSLIWASNDGVVQDERFDVDVDDSADQYDLLVTSADEDLGGQYYIRLGGSEVATVELVVLSKVACNPSEPRETQEGAEVVVTCDSSYHGYKDPSMKWFYKGVEIPSKPNYNEDKTFKSVMANFTARPEHDGTVYNCEMMFVKEDGETEEPPVFHDNCSTATYIVYYAVQNVSISPHAPDDGILQIEIGDYLNCTGVGNEPPSFDWYCHDRTKIIQGAILPITSDLSGQQMCFCHAYNTVLGQSKSVEANITFNAVVSGAEIPRSPFALLVMCAFLTYMSTLL